MNFSALLTPSDQSDLSIKYGLDFYTVAKMEDSDWCAFIGCEQDDLAFHLFDGYENEDFMQSLNNISIDGEDDMDEEEAFMTQLFSDDDYAEIVPITRYASQAKKPKQRPMPRPYEMSGYSSPSPAGVSKKSTVVPHHLEVIQ